MPCYFNGQITGDDRVSCSATPGKIWQSEPSLMYAPTTGQGVPMAGTTEAPMQNLTAYMIPGAGPAKQVATKALPYVKKGVQSLFTKPGVVQKTIPKMKQMADGTVKQIGTKTVDKAGRVMSVPRASATAIGAAGLYDNAVSPNPYGGAGPVTDRQVVNRQDAPNIFNQGAAGQPPSPPPPPASSYWSDTWDRARAPAAGGSGAWDTNLYRLGEQMSHMGTPLSKRGKGPSDRWTTASAASAKAAGTAAGTLTKNQRDSYNKMIPNKDTLIKMFLKKKKGIFSDSKPGTPEYAVAASQAARYAEIGHQLIIDGIEPTSANIEKRRKELKDKKK